MSLRERMARTIETPIPILGKYRRLVDRKYIDAAEGCIRCVSCKMQHAEYNKGLRWGEICPTGSYFGFESHYAFGRLNMMVGLTRGDHKWTEGLVHSLYSCTSCGACSEICDFMQEINPTGTEFTKENPLRPLDVIEEFKRVGVIEGAGPPPALKVMAKSVEEMNNPINQPHEKRMAWWPNEIKRPPAKSKLMFFVGCTPSYSQREMARSTVRILNKLGIEFGATPDEVCCGNPLFRSGQRDTGLKTLRGAIDAMEKAGAETVFTACAGCYRVLKSDAPKNDLDVPFKVVHTMDVLKERKKELKSLFKTEWKEKVTYHDPCDLGRHMGYYETPREILSMIPGLELVEMHRNKRWSWCCGAGGGAVIAFPDMASWTARERLWEAHDVGASAITTLCPGCRLNLTHAIPTVRRWINVKVYDITEIIWELTK